MTRQPPPAPKKEPGFNYPYGFPLDHVPVTPTGRIYKARRAFRRACTAALIAAAIIAGLIWPFS